MAITVQRQFESAVTEMYQDAFVGSSIENGVTIITFDLRQHDFQQELGTPARLCWRKESYRKYLGIPSSQNGQWHTVGSLSWGYDGARCFGNA